MSVKERVLVRRKVFSRLFHRKKKSPLVSGRPVKVNSVWKRRLSFGVIGVAAALGVAGCSTENNARLRNLLDNQAARLGSSTAGYIPVPGAGSIGSKIGSGAVKLVLGENPGKIKGDPRLEFDSNGNLVVKPWWFEPYNIAEGTERGRRQISFVERITNKTGLFPDEIMLAIGANSKLGQTGLEKKILLLETNIKSYAKRIHSFMGEAYKLFPNMPREKLVVQLASLYSQRDKLAIECSVLKAFLTARKIDPEASAWLVESLLLRQDTEDFQREFSER